MTVGATFFSPPMSAPAAGQGVLGRACWAGRARAVAAVGAATTAGALALLLPR